MIKKKVLIIDDEEDFCRLMQFYLSKKDCEVTISHTLKDGLEGFYKNFPDIIILDNNLPDGLGWTATQKILDAAPHVNLFLISANEHPDEKEYERSNVHVVEKPISISQVDSFLK